MAGNTSGASSSSKEFGSMDEMKQKEIASQGGKAVHEKGAAHEFDSKESERDDERDELEEQLDNRDGKTQKDRPLTPSGEHHAKEGQLSNKNP